MKGNHGEDRQRPQSVDERKPAGLRTAARKAAVSDNIKAGFYIGRKVVVRP